MRRLGVVFAGLGHMGAGSNTLFDASGYGNHGTLTNMAIPATATSGWLYDSRLARNAFRTDGSNDRISLPIGSGTDIGGDYSGAYWARIDVLPSSQAHLFSCYDGTSYWYMSRVSYPTANYLRFETSSGTTVWDNAAWRDYNWHHFAYTKSGAVMRIYFDGSVVSSITNAETAAKIINQNLTIGLAKFPSNQYIYAIAATFSDVLLRIGSAFCQAEVSALADPSNVMLKIGSDSLLLDPRRRLFRAFPSGGGAPAAFKPYWIPQRNRMIGATL